MHLVKCRDILLFNGCPIYIKFACEIFDLLYITNPLTWKNTVSLNDRPPGGYSIFIAGCYKLDIFHDKLLWVITSVQVYPIRTVFLTLWSHKIAP